MALPNTNGVFIHQGYNCSPNLVPTGQSIQVSATDITPVSNAVNALDQNFATPYQSYSTYEVGQWCIYNHNLYQCTTAITSAEEWNSDHWEARAATNQDINSLRDVQIDSSTLTPGQALVYKNGHWENGAGGGGGATSLDDLTDVELTTPTANETLVCEIVNNDPVFKNKATTWTGTEAEYNAILVKDPNVTYYITDGDSDARYIICTQAQYNAWKTAGTLESDTPYYITDGQTPGSTIDDTTTTSTNTWSALKVSNTFTDTSAANALNHLGFYLDSNGGLCQVNEI